MAGTVISLAQHASNGRCCSPANLGWLFDGFELWALFVTVAFLRFYQLLDPSQYAQIPRYAGYILAITVFGWATGGFVGGIVADYIGRKRTMMAILVSSLVTALITGLGSRDVRPAALSRRDQASALEWVTGALLVSEVWPDHARTPARAAGCCSAASGTGSF